MQWQLLWYVLAGLIIGLTASTLWEWLYFRRKRMELRDQRVTELEAEVRLLREQNRELAAATTRAMPVATDYHSPAVFLESEEAESLQDDVYTPSFDDVEPSASVAAALDVATPITETPAAKESIVDDSPVAERIAEKPVVEEVSFVSPEPAIADEAEPLPMAEADVQDEFELDSVTESTPAPVPELQSPPPENVDEAIVETDGQDDREHSEEDNV